MMFMRICNSLRNNQAETGNLMQILPDRSPDLLPQIFPYVRGLDNADDTGRPFDFVVHQSDHNTRIKAPRLLSSCGSLLTGT